MKKLKAYTLVNRDDKLSYSTVIAYNIKEAKKLMMEECSDWIYEECDSYIKYKARWCKNAIVYDLKHGEFIDGVELLKRDICNYLEWDCRICGKENVWISKITNELICCEECEEKNERIFIKKIV